MEESVFMDRVRNLVSVLDRGVYGLISSFCDIIEKLANTTIISSGSIDEISGKIYALVAVFMIFKISFSLINYIVNPDMIVDKVKGGGALVRNIVITFVLIIFVPFGFDFLYQAQSAILSDAIIEKLIYGSTYSEKSIDIIMDADYCGDMKASTSNIGDYVGLMAFKTFFQIDDESKDFADIEKRYCTASVGNGRASVGNLLKSDVYNAPHGASFGHNYVVNYTIFISTIVGAILALVFLSFCFDIAMRSIKLLFLEILAPVPIISYIDPDKSKNGMFSKWLKEVTSTWLSLFMRLLAFHIAIYFISFLNENASFDDNVWINLLIIIGILMFAKELPKLLENILGIKASGSFNLNPFKKIGNEALGGKIVTGAAVAGAGLAVGGVAQSASNMYAFGRDKYNLRKAIASEDDPEKKAKLQAKYNRMGTARFMQTASGGLIGGARRGVISGYKTGEKGSGNVFRNLKGDLKSGNTARNNRTAIRNFNTDLRDQIDKLNNKKSDLQQQRDDGIISMDEYNQKVSEYDKQIDEYSSQRYGWFERNVTENVDKAAGVKNEYGGYGYYDKQISKLKRDIENNVQQEEALRTAAANYCTNNGLDFYTLYNDFMKNGATPTDPNLEAQFNGIKNLDDATKQMRADMKGFQEMLDARQSVKKDK